MSRARGRKYQSEVQFINDGWAVARRRPHQHTYELLYHGQLVGWLLRAEDGWRWHVDWSPGSASRPAQFGIDRLSPRAYSSWQTAAGRLARTDVGRRIAAAAGAPRVTGWEQGFRVRGTPWVPRAATSAEPVIS